jgi:hypothetical protein
LFSCTQKKANNSISTINPNIDYTKIDLFPILPKCKNISQTNQKECFYNAISKRIKTNLNLNKIKFDVPTKDSIMVNFVIDSIGKAQVVSIIHTFNNYKKDSLDFYIKTSFNKLPIMQPAIKMGIPVNAQFRIPIVLKPINKS